jgi:hypothetical protein
VLTMLGTTTASLSLSGKGERSFEPLHMTVQVCFHFDLSSLKLRELTLQVPGYDTKTNNNLRLWGSKAASGEFDFQKFNSGEYESSVADQQRAETISAVLYPNDKYVLLLMHCFTIADPTQPRSWQGTSIEATVFLVCRFAI